MKTLGKIILGILIFVVLYTTLFGLSFVGIELGGILKAKQVEIQREVFEESKSHIKGMADDLAKYKYEFTTSENDMEKEAIADLIRERYADFDVNDLNNQELKQFLKNIRNGNY